MEHARSATPSGGQNVAEAWHLYLEELADVEPGDYVEAEERAWDQLQDALRRIADDQQRKQDNRPLR